MARPLRPSTTTGTMHDHVVAQPTTSTGGANATAVTAAPVGSHLRPRRSPRLVAAGVLLASLGGLGGALAYQQTSHANQVVVMAHALSRGQTVQATDLSVVTIDPAPGVNTLPASSMEGLVGKQALVDLPQGSLVGQGSIGSANLAPNTVEVGLKLAAGRVPNQSMPPGTPVQLVQVSDEKSGTSGATVVDATLVTAPQVLSDGSSHVVDVVVRQQDAQKVADLAARDLLVLVRKAGG